MIADDTATLRLELAPAPVDAAVLGEGQMVAPGYRVLHHVYRSRNLDIYEVWSEERGARAIAKRLVPDRVEAVRTERLREEAGLLLGMSHPHLVRAYELTESLEAEPQPVLILETLMGMTVEHLLHDRRPRLDWHDLSMLGIQLTSAIRYLHARGILHMDLKPGNIVASGGLVKVIDLSLARRPGARGDVGTRDYMPPEAIRGEAAAAPADVWGIGCVLWEAAAGEPAFSSSADELRPQLLGRAAPVRTRRRLPRELGAIIDACLAPSAAERPGLSEIHDTLASLAGEPLLVADRSLPDHLGAARAAA